jgi:hypothetical protein
MERYLYRGFGLGTYSDIVAALTPKVPGRFEHIFCHDETIKYDGSATFGRSARNAALLHQLNQAGYPTSGVSTSPHRDRAIFYALDHGKNTVGTVLTIDRDLLAIHGVFEHRVSDTVTNPCIPEDDEVILVSMLGDVLPLPIVVFEETVLFKNHGWVAKPQ